MKRLIELQPMAEKQAEPPLLGSQVGHSKLRVATKPVLVTDTLQGRTWVPCFTYHPETAMERNRKERNKYRVISIKRVR